ncbi:DNA alkylation repair protein [bacterium LRH843]|nr:DNA alkylation repair protein [bacterium LRH843]
MNRKVDHYVELVVNEFDSNRNEQNKAPMKKYMRDKFEFLGIRSPQRKLLSSSLMKEIGCLPREQMIEFVKQLWELPEREYQYFAMDYVYKFKKILTREDIELLRYLITTKSWWDTVDLLASNCAGYLFQTFPDLIDEYAKNWATDENLWLRRTAILFQLKYKDKTDQELLFQVIEENADDPLFFIRKGIGWALREYSKTSPSAVIEFVHTHQLSNLSRREALKYLNKKQD